VKLLGSGSLGRGEGGESIAPHNCKAERREQLFEQEPVSRCQKGAKR